MGGTRELSRIRAGSLVGAPAYDLDTGKFIGTVRDLVIGPADRVTHLGIAPPAWWRSGFAVPLEEAIIPTSERVNFLDPTRLDFEDYAGRENLLYSRREPIGRVVLTSGGICLGLLSDYTFLARATSEQPSPEIGQLVEVHTQLMGSQRSFQVVEVVSLGEDALVIEPDPLHQEELKLLRLEQARESQTNPTARGEQAGSPARAFEERKLRWLSGRPAHRNIYARDGELIVAQGDPLTPEVLNRLEEEGMLTAVFFEATLVAAPRRGSIPHQMRKEGS